jgi:hypothetical protein
MRPLAARQSAATLGVLAVVLAGVLMGRRAGVPPAQPGDSYGVDCPPDTLCTEEQAIQASIDATEAVTVTAAVARLVSMDVAYGVVGLEHGDPSDWAYLAKPVWLVGVQYSGATVGDLNPVSYPPDTPMDGVWFLWVASGARLKASGGLASVGPLSMSGIASLENQSLAVDPPTPFPTVTPGPSPTFVW